MSLEKRQQRKANRLAKSIRKADEAAGISEEMESRNKDSDSGLIFDDVKQNKSEEKSTDTPQYTFPKEETQEAPGNKLLNVVTNQVANEKNISGSALYSVTAQADKNVTFGETQKLAEAAAKVGEAKVQVEKENENVINQQLEDITEKVEDTDEVDIGKEPGVKEEKIGGTGATIGGVVSGGGAQKPSYVSQATTSDVEKEMAKTAKEASELDYDIPSETVEKLTIQDYYPSANDDIAVGTWTGSVLGSQTIYAGGGSLLPLGLYDARARALDAAAKKKQALIDKIYELPNTADQYNLKYQDNAYDFIEKSLDEYGSYEAMAKDPKWRREMTRIKNIGQEITFTDKQADKLLEDVSKNRWVPKATIQRAVNFKSGLVENLDEILDGTKPATKEIQYFRSYENGTSHVDELVKNGLFSEARMSETPINLRTGGKYDSETWQQERKDFFQTMSVSRDKDALVSGIRKYFDVSNAEALIDNWFETSNSDPATKDDVLNYLVAQIPQKVIFDKAVMDNKDLEWAKYATERDQWERKFAAEQEAKKSHYTVKNEVMEGTDREGRTVNDRFTEIASNKKATAEQKAQMMVTALNKFSGKGKWDPFSKTAVIVDAVPADQSSKSIKTNSKQLKTRIQVKYKGKWIPKTVTVSELSQYSDEYLSNNILTENGKKYNSNDIQAIKSGVRNNSFAINAQNNETAVGMVDRNGNLSTVTNQNINQFNPANKRYIERTVGKGIIQNKPIIDEDGKQKTDTETGELLWETTNVPGTFYFESNMSDAPSRNTLDAQRGSLSQRVSMGQTGGMSYQGSSSNVNR